MAMTSANDVMLSLRRPVAHTLARFGPKHRAFVRALSSVALPSHSSPQPSFPEPSREYIDFHRSVSLERFPSWQCGVELTAFTQRYLTDPVTFTYTSSIFYVQRLLRLPTHCFSPPPSPFSRWQGGGDVTPKCHRQIIAV